MAFNVDLESIDKELSSNKDQDSINDGSNSKDSRFNINLESIVEDEEIRSDPAYINLATAIAVNSAVSKLLEERELQRIEEVHGLKKNVVRGGKIKSVVDCPPGYKSSKGRCVKMSSIEIIQLAKRARKAALTRHRHSGMNQKHMMKSMKFSEKIRNKNAAKMAKVKFV